MSNVLAFQQELDFYLSTSEYLAMVWLYKHELKPTLQKFSLIKKEPHHKPIEKTIDLVQEVRRVILNEGFPHCKFSPVECLWISNHLSQLFSVFDQEKFVARKPDKELLHDVRGKICDLIQADALGNLATIQSPMTGGKIKFSLTFERYLQ